MLEENAIVLMRNFIQRHKKEVDLALDLTLGRGKDSNFILETYPGSRVLAFDIQEEALDWVKENLKNQDRLQVVLDGHQNLDSYLDQEVDLAMMNLGYLPGGDKTIITKAATTVIAIEKALEALKVGGLFTLLVYRSHPGAGEEVAAVEDLVRALDQRDYRVQRIEFYNQKNQPPVFFGIEKRMKK